jgi:hypothetical protein
MSHLLALEDWPEAEQPQSVAYFCGVLETPKALDGTPEPAAEIRAVRGRAQTFLDRDVATLWPAAVDDGGFRWPLLCGGGQGAAKGSEQLDTQYWRANIDPSDRYVQSLPGTDQFRLHPGRTSFTNLVVAGDWTDSGLNAGCVESAVRSGQLAAKAVCAQIESSEWEGET